MSADKHAPVPCPACAGKGLTDQPPAAMMPRNSNVCPVCHGNGTVHPYKAELYRTGELAEHEAGAAEAQHEQSTH